MRNTMMKKMAVLVVLTGALAGGLASAQTGKTTVRTTLSDEISQLEKEVANLSPEEKVDRAVEKIDGMKTTLTETGELLERVRSEERDIQKLNCINEKSAAIKGYVKVSEQSFEGLKQAVTGKDDRAQTHHYTLIAISGEKVTGLGEEARVCAGEVLQYSDGTVVDVIQDPDIAEFDYLAVDNGELDFEYVDDRLPELTLFQ